MTDTPRILVVDNGSFLEKYILRELADNPLRPRQEVLHLVGCDDPVDAVISATGSVITVETGGDAPRRVSITGHNIVGTGMTGPMAAMVKAIYRGTYFHIDGDESRMSVVHAVDMARAAVRALADITLRGDFTLTDYQNPKRLEVAEALAARLDGKRVFTLSAKRARHIAAIGRLLPFLPINPAKLQAITSDDIAVASAWREAVADWRPTPVVDYLLTHNYDETSL